MTVTVKEALKQVLSDMNALSPEQLRVELDKHSNGPLSVAMRETQEFLHNFNPESK